MADTGQDQGATDLDDGVEVPPLVAHFADVPGAGPEASPDVHWRELQNDALLPVAYMPPAMGGEHPAWMGVASWVLIGIFLTATSLGVCLTYWPGL